MIDQTGSEINVGVYKLANNATIPFLATELSACYDICACLRTETIKAHGRNGGIPVENFGTEQAYFQLFPDEQVLVPTGLIFALPVTHHLKLLSRSGNVWKKRLKVANQPAVIDSDYTKETFVVLHNNSIDMLIIRDGDAIAQGEFCKNTHVNLREIKNKSTLDSFIMGVSEFSRRAGGLGHTGSVGDNIDTVA